MVKESNNGAGQMRTATIDAINLSSSSEQISGIVRNAIGADRLDVWYDQGVKTYNELRYRVYVVGDEYAILTAAHNRIKFLSK